MPLLRTEMRERVALVTLDDPRRRNAISLAMADELTAAFHTLREAADPCPVIVTGAPPAFSAGADLSDLEHATPDSLRRIYEGFLAVARYPFATIAAVNGPAVGAGLNLALACDVRLAGRSARFDSRFQDLCLHPGGGHTWMLREILGPQGAAAVVLLGEALDGPAAVRHGLAWNCVEDADLLGEARRMASRAAGGSRPLQRRLKATLRAMGAVRRHEEAVELELEAQLWSLEQPAFRERLADLRSRIAGKRPASGTGPNGSAKPRSDEA
jgi:enoyl-CoA hydratase